MNSPEGQAETVTDYRPKRRLDLNYRNIEGETVVLDRQSGLVHQLNPTASLIWNLCDGDRTIDSIAAQLVAAYEIELSTAIKDVAKLVAGFQELRLVVAGPETSNP